MSDLEALVRDAYLVAATSPRDVADEVTVASLVGAARARRRGRIAGGSLVLAAGVVGVALGAFAMSTGTAPPAVSSSPSVSPSLRTDVTYLSSLPGITGAETLDVGVPSGLPGAPDFYPTSQEIVDQAGPGWGYTVFGPLACTPKIPHPIAALVSPGGEAFRADDFPDGVCSAMPVVATGRLLFVDTGSTDSDTPLYVVNFSTGAVTYLDAGVGDYGVEAMATSGGRALVAVRHLRKGDETSIVVAVDPDGNQRIVNLGVDAHHIMWGDSDGELMFATGEQEVGDLRALKWFAIGQGDATARPVTVDIRDSFAAVNCSLQSMGGRDGLTYTCDDGAYRLHANGTVEAATPPTDHVLRLESTYNELVVGDEGALNAHIPYPLDSGTVLGLDPTFLDPASHGPWQRTAEVTAIGTPINDEVGGIEASVVQPDGDYYYGTVVALVGKSGTMIVLPSSFHGEPSTAGEWLWWQPDD